MILFIFGADSFRARQKILEIKKKYHGEIDKLSTSEAEYDGRNLKVEDLNRLFATDSLFASKRLIQINDVFANKQSDFLKSLTQYLEIDKSENIVVFCDQSIGLDASKRPGLIQENNKFKALSKDQQKLWLVLSKAYSQHFGLLTPGELTKWIEKKVTNEALNIDKKALQVLVGLIGSDLWLMNNEVDKLIAYKKAEAVDTVINNSDIKLLVNHEMNQSIFELTDAISNRDKARAITIFNEQLAQNTAELFLITMLVRQFRILLGVRQGLDNGLNQRQIGEQLKLNSFVLNKSINQARNYNLSSLTSIISTLAKIDYRYKTGGLSVETMIDILIARL